MDRGHERTEQVISKIEGRLRAEYEQAAKEVQEILDDYMERFALKDKKWQEWVKDGKSGYLDGKEIINKADEIA